MKIEVKKDGLKREIKFEIPKDRVTQALSEVYEGIGKVAKIKGYRPGKAPRHILEKQHGKLAEEEALKKIIPEAYREAIEKEKINPLDLPDIEDVLFKDGMIHFTAKLDVKPEIKLKDYKGIKVTRKTSVVVDEEINKTLDFFKKGQGGKATLDGKTALGSEIPVNTSGGLKACGHPVGATGIKQAVEAVWQLRGQAEGRQVKDAHIGLTHNVGGSGATAVVHIYKNQ